MLKRLDHDSLIGVMKFLTLSEILEGLALVDTQFYHLFEEDHHGFLTNLIMEKILFSEEVNLVEMFIELNRIFYLETLLMNDRERKIICCDRLSQVFEKGEFNIGKILEIVKSTTDWKELIQVDSYESIRTCVECCKRLAYISVVWGLKNLKGGEEQLIELLYSPDHVQYNHDNNSTIYLEFLKIAQSYNFSKGRVYKFCMKFTQNNNGLKVMRIYSRPREVPSRSREIIFKDYQDAYLKITVPSVAPSFASVLIHQESIEMSNFTISTNDDLQSSASYKRNSVSGYRVSPIIYTMLYNYNYFMHQSTEPYKCGDLRAHKRGLQQPKVLYTLSRRYIKRLTFPHLTAWFVLIPLSAYVLYRFVDFTGIDRGDDWSANAITLLSLALDITEITFGYLSIVDHFTNRHRPMNLRFIGAFIVLCSIFSILKLGLSFFNPWLPCFSTFSVSIPLTFSLVTLSFGSFHFSRALYWYVRACDWFYNLNDVSRENSPSPSLLGRMLKRVFNKVTNLFSLNSAENDSPDRCVIN